MALRGLSREGMEGKITKGGYFEINRSGIWKRQKCPLVYPQVNCGDECPLFGEPLDLPGDRVLLGLCKRKWKFTGFEDERE